MPWKFGQNPMNTQAYRDKIGAKNKALWQNPVWRAKRMEIVRKTRHGACSRNHDLVCKLAGEGVSMVQIALRIGTTNHRVSDYLKRHQIPYTYVHRVGKNNPMWTGGRTLDKHGYVLLHQPDHPHANSNGYIREHRVVMEQVLGRYLEPHEVVHHDKEGREARRNNDPSNLKLYRTNAEHLAETRKGKIPRWSPEGKERIRVSSSRPKSMRVSPNPAPHKTSDSSSS